MCTAAADIVTPCYAINSSVKAIQAVVCLLSSLFFPTIVAWNQGPSPTVLRGGQRCGILEEVFWPNLVRNEAFACPEMYKRSGGRHTKEPLLPLGCQVTLLKTRIEPEDMPEFQN